LPAGNPVAEDPSSNCSTGRVRALSHTEAAYRVRDTGWTWRVRHLDTPVSRREQHGVVCEERGQARHNAVGGHRVSW
jgi:hypothetical protein